MKINYLELENELGIVFNNKKLLENALIHRSYLNEHKKFYLPSNEKLEFLGDSVLSLTTTIYLYRHYPELDEGIYTDIKASIVRTESLAEAAKVINIGEYLCLSKGEELHGGRINKNILADSFEALIGAIFIDLGFDAAYNFIVKFLFSKKLDFIIKNRLYLSPKSRLQEIVQSKYKVLPSYVISEEKGPEHLKKFRIAVYLKSKKLAEGNGNSKKEAEEEAAKMALKLIE